VIRSVSQNPRLVVLLLERLAERGERAHPIALDRHADGVAEQQVVLPAQLRIRFPDVDPIQEERAVVPDAQLAQAVSDPTGVLEGLLFGERRSRAVVVDGATALADDLGRRIGPPGTLGHVRLAAGIDAGRIDRFDVVGRVAGFAFDPRIADVRVVDDLPVQGVAILDDPQRDGDERDGELLAKTARADAWIRFDALLEGVLGVDVVVDTRRAPPLLLAAVILLRGFCDAHDCVLKIPRPDEPWRAEVGAGGSDR